MILTCAETKCQSTDKSILKTELKNDTLQLQKTHCSAFLTCTECTTATPACTWSLDKQLCNVTASMNGSEYNTIATNGSAYHNETITTNPDVSLQLLLVHDARSCPKYSVSYTKKDNVSTQYQDVILKVTTDNAAFVGLLNRSQITCYVDGTATDGKLVGADQVACASMTERSVNESTNVQQNNQLSASPSPVMYFAVTVAGVQLQFNNESDYYVTENYNVCTNNKTGGQCVACYWEDVKYRYYCRWCPRDMGCTGLDHNCDVRTLIGSVQEFERVVVQCPAVRITTIDPSYAPWGGGTTIKIGITNHKLLSENRQVKVTVAGFRCLLQPTQASDENMVTCTITPVVNDNSTMKLKDGPVEVEYMSMMDKNEKVSTVVIRSEQIFYFVEPEIISVKPMCGPITGGTQINIHGNFLNAGNELRVFVGDNVTCTITAHNENDVTCITGATKEPTSGKVKLQFDNYLSKYVDQPLFVYTGTPSVDANQTFRAISSGGTRLPVHGRYFSCIQNPLVFVRYNGNTHTSPCQVHNDTYMVCTSPKINRPAPSSVTALPCGFQATFNKGTLVLLQQSRKRLNYFLCPDPVFTDFETDGHRTVTISGLHLDRGYEMPGDLTVLLQNASTVACNVTLVVPERIVCQAPPLQSQPNGAIGSVDETVKDAIVVTVGSNVIYDIKRKSVAYRNTSGYGNPLRLTVLLAGITLVSLIITVLVAIVYCTKITLTAVSSQHTEMQSCEQYNNAVVTDDEDKKN